MPTKVKAVVIGGGIVGVSVLYHLAKAGWRDIVLLERSELTAGSTWHAAAGFHALNGDPNVARLQAYTIGLYKEVEDLSGQSCGLHMTGGLSVAAHAERWDWLRAEWARQQMIGLHSRLVSPDEIKDLCPIMEVGDLKGGLFDAQEGHVDPNGATYAFAKAAVSLGAQVKVRTPVRALASRPDGAWIVTTDSGDYEAGHVVNAAGLWAPRVAEMAGVALPIVPMEHMYVVTEDVAAVSRLPRELPMTVDLDAGIYLRQEQRAVLLGVYEEEPKHWCVEGVPWDFGMELIPDDLERISGALMSGFERFPDVREAGIRRVVNGGMVFTPDGNPIVGPISGVPNFWCACGSMAGFSQNGAIGKALAEWMTQGEPAADVFALDVARFGPHVRGRYLLDKTYENYARRFKLAYPNEQLEAGRPLKTSPVHDAHTAARAVFGASYGLEVPLYFARPGEPAKETPSFLRSNAFEAVGEEVMATRTAAGLLDATGFAKYRVSGPGAEAWVRRVLAGRLPEVGRLRLAPMLNTRGRLMGDLTLFRLAADEFMLFGSGYLQGFHMRWFQAHAVPGATCENVTEAYGGLALSGPAARAVVAALAGDEVADLPSFAVGRHRVGPAGRAIVGRLAITGEPGYEVYVEPAELPALREALMAAGAAFGLGEIGLYAANVLRLEKGFGIWGREFTPDYTPAMCGLSRFVDADRDDFVGAAAVARARDAEPGRKLVMLQVDAADADASGFEPVWRGERAVGFTTSGGFGWSIGQSIALAYVEPDELDQGGALEVSIVGRRRGCRITRVLG